MHWDAPKHVLLLPVHVVDGSNNNNYSHNNSCNQNEKPHNLPASNAICIYMHSPCQRCIVVNVLHAKLCKNTIQYIFKYLHKHTHTHTLAQTWHVYIYVCVFGTRPAAEQSMLNFEFACHNNIMTSSSKSPFCSSFFHVYFQYINILEYLYFGEYYV